MKKPTKYFLWTIAGIGAATIILPVVLLLYFGRGMVGCEYVDHVLGQSRLGDKITSQEEFCDGFGASVFMTISLAEAHGGNKGVIFSYEPYLGPDHPADPPPRVRWVADDKAIIAVDRIYAIHVQHGNLGHDHIQYRIGVLEKRLPFYWKLLDLL